MPGVLQVFGSTGAIQQGDQYHWDYAGGETLVQQWRGDVNAIQNLYSSYKGTVNWQPQLDSLDYNKGRGLATMTASKQVDDGEPLYELLANDVYKPVETKFTALTADQIYAVRQAVANNLTQTQTGFSGDQLNLWKLKVYGTEEYLVTQYVLRETKTVSKRSTVVASYSDVGTVTTPPNTTASNTLIGQVPTGEWLKRPPQVRMVGTRRWQIEQEWWWADKWSSALYGGTGTP